MRGYWKLENENDSSGNSRNLTIRNTVNFNAGRFTNAADFGSSGSTNGLTLTGNPLSANQVTNLTISFWFKLNATTSNANARLYEINTANGGTGSEILCYYNIAAGNITITFAWAVTGTPNTVTNTFTANTTNWYNLVTVKSNQTSFFYINGYQVATATGTGTQLGVAFTYQFGLGTSRNLIAGGWAKIDEFIMEERVWSASEIRKYYTQARGMLI
jgi:hypothetical protein